MSEDQTLQQNISIIQIKLKHTIGWNITFWTRVDMVKFDRLVRDYPGENSKFIQCLDSK